MATLLLWRVAGSVAGRCDAGCYDATSSPAGCRCVCGGVNHGAGLEQAADNTRRMHADWIVAGRAAGRRIDDYDLPPVQLPLF